MTADLRVLITALDAIFSNVIESVPREELTLPRSRQAREGNASCLRIFDCMSILLFSVDSVNPAHTAKRRVIRAGHSALGLWF